MGSIKSGRLEDPTDGSDLSDVETTLRSLGIELRSSNDEFRNFGDVLDEVAQKWDSFSSVQQRAIATSFAGTRMQSRFVALVTNMSEAKEYAEVAADSIGVSAQKMEVYQDSLLAKQNRVTASFEKFASIMLPDSFVGYFYDLSSGLLQLASVADGLPVKLVALLTAFGASKAAVAGLKETKLYESIAKTFTDLAKPKMTGFGINVAIIIEEPA